MNKDSPSGSFFIGKISNPTNLLDFKIRTCIIKMTVINNEYYLEEILMENLFISTNLIGRKLDQFEAPVYHNDDFGTVTDEEMEGKWKVFVFYPGDFTFVCPTELEDLANHYEEFKKLDAEIYAVSTDSEFVHKAWHDASEAIAKVQYPMVSDRNFQLSDMFGVLIEEEGQALRGSFVVNPENEIVAYEIHSPGIGRTAKELLRKLKAAQYVYKHGDQVCPANWEEGDETLTPGIDLVGKI